MLTRVVLTRVVRTPGGRMVTKDVRSSYAIYVPNLLSRLKIFNDYVYRALDICVEK